MSLWLLGNIVVNNMTFTRHAFHTSMVYCTLSIVSLCHHPVLALKTSDNANFVKALVRLQSDKKDVNNVFTGRVLDSINANYFNCKI